MMIQKFKDFHIEPQTEGDRKRIERFVEIINDDALYDPEGLE